MKIITIYLLSLFISSSASAEGFNSGWSQITSEDIIEYGKAIEDAKYSNAILEQRQNEDKKNLMLIAKGDFDNNGIDDTASLMKSHSSDEFGFFVTLNYSDKPAKTLVLEKMDGVSSSLVYGIKSVTDIFDAEELCMMPEFTWYDICPDLLARNFRYEGDYIAALKFDSSSWIWVWDKTNQKFIQFYTGD